MEIQDNRKKAKESLRRFMGDGRAEKLLSEIDESMNKYVAAMKQVTTYVEILQNDINRQFDYNPIDHISYRLKSPQSIIQKMRKDKLNFDVNTMEKHITDIAGIRIVCSFEDDIFKIVEIIKNNSDYILFKEKDYVSNPKPSGYRSYHLIFYVSVHLLDGTQQVPVELQIRTMAMDFWASLEHEIKYKNNGIIPDYIKQELQNCSKISDELDVKMLEIKNMVNEKKTKK